MSAARQKRSVLAWIHYIWLRFGLFMLVAMPIAAFLMFRAQGFDRALILRSDQSLRVDHNGDDAITFLPRQPRVGLLLIPGCPPDPFAYAPFARQLALRDIAVAIVKVPYRCAPLPSHEVELASRVARVMETIDTPHWILAGHSRGATHALRIVLTAPQRFAGVVILGSSHPRDRDYSQLAIPVMKIVGTHDGVATLAASHVNRHLLPATAKWVVIDGANHSQFAHYGFQLWDQTAQISRDEQQTRVVDEIVGFSRGLWLAPRSIGR